MYFVNRVSNFKSATTRSILSALILTLSLIAATISPVTTATAKDLANPENWLSSENKDNQFVGKIWSTKDNKFITPAELAKALTSKRFILLGETHDNPDHHYLQAEIINQLSAGPNKPALVIEMIKVDQMPRLNAYRAQQNAKAEALGTALQWKQHGWPDWKIYQPIGEQIFTHNLEVFPGHTTRMMIDHLIKSDLSIIPDEAKKTFKLNEPLAKPLDNALQEDIRVSHCNRLPERVVAPMAMVQRFRDAWMADVMLQAEEDDKGKTRPVILIAGKGHTRTDRGVPWYLNKRTTPGTSVTINFTEAEPSAKQVTDLGQKSPEQNQVADYLWVTPSVKREDPCNNMPDFGK